MTGTVEIVITNEGSVVGHLQAAQAEVVNQVMAVFRQWGELIMTEAKVITPVDTGMLRSSGRVYEDAHLGVTLVFGEGGTVPYALWVHENMAMRHLAPTSAKFLERPFFDALPNVQADLLRATRRVVGP